MSRKKADNSKVIIAKLNSGSFFGETALLGQSIRTATVEAIDSVTLLRLRRKDVLKIAKQYPEINEYLTIANERRLAENTDD